MPSKFGHPLPTYTPAKRNSPFAIQTHQARNVLTEIDSQRHDIDRSAPLRFGKVSDHIPIAHRGTGHSIVR